MTDAHSEEYPRILNGSGCLFGQNLAARFDAWKCNLRAELKGDYKERMDDLEDKIDRIQWLLVGTMASLAASAVLLAVNLLVP